VELNPESETPVSATRRTVLATAVTGVGLTLAGCSTYGRSDDTAATTARAAPSLADTAAAASPSETPSESPSPTPADPPANALAKVSDIPVGGGKIFADQKVVVTQPTAGTIKAFSAVCTHQGCLVTSVSKTIDCPCHGSKFSLKDGSRTAGPAQKGLDEKQVTVSGTNITLA
jgi:Rieske Fe-S protein